jgi:hypothetical protein
MNTNFQRPTVALCETRPLMRRYGLMLDGLNGDIAVAG